MMAVLPELQTAVIGVRKSVVHVGVEAPEDNANDSFVLQFKALLQDANNIPSLAGMLLSHFNICPRAHDILTIQAFS